MLNLLKFHNKIRPWRPLTLKELLLINKVYLQGDLGGQDSTPIKKFEQEWSSYLGAKYSILTNSGTAALHMAIESLRLEKGSEVITPALSFVSSAFCSIYEGLIPVFCDVKENDLNIDENKIEQLITPQTKAIMVVHLNGVPANIKAIQEIASRHNLKIIEDASQAHGAKTLNQKVGTFGDVAAFSLNKTKSLPAGEGGIFVTNNDKYYQEAKLFQSFGMSQTQESPMSIKAGFMYRSNPFTAILASQRLKKLDIWNKKRSENFNYLNSLLQDIPQIETIKIKEGQPAYWSYVFKFKNGLDKKNEFIKKLNKAGIKTAQWQKYLLPEHPVLKKYANDFSQTKKINDGLVWLLEPINPLNGKKELNYLARIIKNILADER